MEYNENDDQLFIKFQSDAEPIEFLITKQPLAVINSGYVRKAEIRETVETGLQLESENYYKTFERPAFGLTITVRVHIDEVLRVVETVEARIF